METLVLMEQHRDVFYTRAMTLGPGRFGYSPARGINRLSFPSATGIRPTPLEIPATPAHSFSSPETPSPSANSDSDNDTEARTTARSAPIPVNGNVCNKGTAFDDDCLYKSLSFPELWAGPTYSNSPPPSSLPMPKFSIQRKRTVSLELPNSTAEIKMHPIAKSAPPSPTRGHNPSTREIFHSADSATLTLRRMLNLDVDYE